MGWGVDLDHGGVGVISRCGSAGRGRAVALQHYPSPVRPATRRPARPARRNGSSCSRGVGRRGRTRSGLDHEAVRASVSVASTTTACGASAVRSGPAWPGERTPHRGSPGPARTASRAAAVLRPANRGTSTRRRGGSASLAAQPSPTRTATAAAPRPPARLGPVQLGTRLGAACYGSVSGRGPSGWPTSLSRVRGVLVAGPQLALWQPEVGGQRPGQLGPPNEGASATAETRHADGAHLRVTPQRMLSAARPARSASGAGPHPGTIALAVRVSPPLRSGRRAARQPVGQHPLPERPHHPQCGETMSSAETRLAHAHGQLRRRP